MSAPDDLIGDMIAEVARTHGMAICLDAPIVAVVLLNQVVLRRYIEEGSVCVRCWCCAEPRAPRSFPPLVKGGEGGLVAGWRGAEANKSPPTPL